MDGIYQATNRVDFRFTRRNSFCIKHSSLIALRQQSHHLNHCCRKDTDVWGGRSKLVPFNLMQFVSYIVALNTKGEKSDDMERRNK